MGRLIGLVRHVLSVGLTLSILTLKRMARLVSGRPKLMATELLPTLWTMLGTLSLLTVAKSTTVLTLGLFVLTNLWWEKHRTRLGDGMLNVVLGLNEKAAPLFIPSFNRRRLSFLEREVLFRWNSVGPLPPWADLVAALLLSPSAKRIRMVSPSRIDLDT